MAEIDPALFGALVAILVITGLVFGIILMYISSVMRFILFDSVMAKECHIREGWSRRQGPGWRYFLWKLVYLLVTLAALIVLVGIPLGFAFAVGWLKDPKEHVLPLVLGGVVLFFVLLIFFVLLAVIFVLTKDFVIPQMALENIGAFEGWRRLVADDRGREGRIRGLHRNEDSDGHRRGDRGRNRNPDFGFVHRHTDHRIEHPCRPHGQNSRAHLERLYDYSGGGGREHSAGNFSISGRADFRAGHRFLSRILDLFFCGSLSRAEPGALSCAAGPTCASDFAGSSAAVRAAAAAACT